jgi:hypothetical protein
MEEKPKYERGHKMYLDKEQTVESAANPYFECRDGVIDSVEYVDHGGNNPYGWTRLMLCKNHKHEHLALIRQTMGLDGNLIEESMVFDSDSFEFLGALINGKRELLGGKFELLRDY